MGDTSEETLIDQWFACWENGNYKDIPVSADFQHTSPFGTKSGKDNYLALVEKNEDQFLGHSFKIHDLTISKSKACVRYSTKKGSDESMEVSEWFYFEDGLIKAIYSYYHIGEIRIEKELK